MARLTIYNQRNNAGALKYSILSGLGYINEDTLDYTIHPEAPKQVILASKGIVVRFHASDNDLSDWENHLLSDLGIYKHPTDWIYIPWVDSLERSEVMTLVAEYASLPIGLIRAADVASEISLILIKKINKFIENAIDIL